MEEDTGTRCPGFKEALLLKAKAKVSHSLCLSFLSWQVGRTKWK